MGLVSQVGKSLFNAGSKAVKIAAKNPKTTIAAGAAAVGGYTIGKILSNPEKSEKQEKSSVFSTIAKLGLLAATGLLLGAVGRKLVKKIKINKAATKAENIVIQKTPDGVVKDKLDMVMKNFKNHISKLNEERCYFKGSSEEFSKRLQAHYNDLKKGYPEYTDYIKKHLDEFMNKY